MRQVNRVNRLDETASTAKTVSRIEPDNLKREESDQAPRAGNKTIARPTFSMREHNHNKAQPPFHATIIGER
jgi:hypothetical protein